MSDGNVSMSEVVDDKSEHCVPFILNCTSKNSSNDAHQSPIFIGVNGAQGSGKTTLVSITAPSTGTIDMMMIKAFYGTTLLAPEVLCSSLAPNEVSINIISPLPDFHCLNLIFEISPVGLHSC